MEVVSGNTLLPGDPRLIDHIVCELKSQGIFDQFRKECIADVDTKPAYQNLRQRVEGSVSGFLKTQTWSPDMNKNQLREMLRKNIYESGFLETGVERIVDQVVNPKINTVFLPQVEDVVYKFLGLEKPQRSTTNRLNGPLTINTFDLLPTDLDPISPDSEVLDKSLNKSDKSCETDKLDDSKLDDFESPPFELITEQSVFLPHEESSNDSHLSGISGLTSNSNMSDGVLKMTSAPDMMNQDSQLSKVSSNSHLSIITNDDKHSEKMDISDDTQTSKHSKVEVPGSGDTSAPENGLVFNLKEQVDMMQTREAPEVPEAPEALEAPERPEEIKAEVNLDENSKHSEKQEEPGKDEADAKPKEADNKPKDEKQLQKTDSKERSRKDSDRRSGSKYDRERKDKDKDRDRDKDKRDKDKSRSSSSSKDRDRDKYKDKKDSKSRERDKDSSKDSKDKDLKEKKDKSKDDKDTKKDEKKETKSEDKKDRDRDSKSERHRTSSSSKRSSRDRSKSDRKDSTSSSSRDKYKGDGKDSKSEKRPPDSKKSDGKPREDGFRSKERDRERDRSRSDSRRDSKSGSSRDKERRDSKKSSRKDKDDHSSLKDKKPDSRRSTDRDSNDGSSGNASSANKDSSDSKSKSAETSDNSQASGDSNQSGNTEPQDTEPQPAADTSESTSTATADDGDNASFPEREETCDGPQVKLRKPKFASNIFEARRLMKVRKKMEKRERKRQARLDQNLREAGNGDSLEEAHQSTEAAGNVTETDDDKETSIEVKELIVTEVTGHEERECEEGAAGTAPAPETEDKQEEVSVNSVVSKASWDALEAKLAQNMMNIDYNSYVDDTSDRSPGECSVRGKSDDEDCLFFNPQIANLQKMGPELLEPGPKSGEPVKMAPPGSSNADRPSRRSRKPNLKYCSNDYTSEITFEEEADEVDTEAAAAPQKKPRKRKLEVDMDSLDPDNNNKRIHAGFDGAELPDMEYEDEHEPSPCASNTSSSSVEHPLRLRQSKGKKSRKSDLTAVPVQSEQFPLPLSPESDISGHSFEARAVRPEERETVPKTRSASSSTKCQRYSSDDLYKPRPFVSGTRRTRGTLNTDQAAKDAR